MIYNQVVKKNIYYYVFHNLQNKQMMWIYHSSFMAFAMPEAAKHFTGNVN